jgi:hypothetical protein
VYWHRDRHFVSDWRHFPDVTAQELPASYRSEPPARMRSNLNLYPSWPYRISNESAAGSQD